MTKLNSGVESIQDSAFATTRIFHVLLDLSEARIRPEEAEQVYLARCLGYLKYMEDSFTWQVLSENVFQIEITALRDLSHADDPGDSLRELAQELGAYLVCHPAYNFSHEGVIRDCYIKVYEVGSDKFWGTQGSLETGTDEHSRLFEKLGREILNA